MHSGQKRCGPVGVFPALIWSEKYPEPFRTWRAPVCGGDLAARPSPERPNPIAGREPRLLLLPGRAGAAALRAGSARIPAALPARGPRPAATHLLGVLAQGDAQGPEPLLQLANVHHAVPVAVQLLEQGLVARRRLRVLAGRGGQHEAPQPAQHGPGGAGRPGRAKSPGEPARRPPAWLQGPQGVGRSSRDPTQAGLGAQGGEELAQRPPPPAARGQGQALPRAGGNGKGKGCGTWGDLAALVPAVRGAAGTRTRIKTPEVVGLSVSL